MGVVGTVTECSVCGGDAEVSRRQVARFLRGMNVRCKGCRRNGDRNG